MHQVYRQEKKYWITLVDLARLTAGFQDLLAQDEHNGPGGYPVRSLYFDTLDEGDYQEKLDGLECRRKLRLRIYDPAAEFVLLEMKQKQGSYQHKRSLRLCREDGMELAEGRYSCLLRYPDPFAGECFGLLNRKGYRPKTIVEYRRTAYVARENRTRITFDREIRATEACLDLFHPQLNLYPVLDPMQAVLEVKYQGFLLSYVKEWVSRADRSEQSVSKYCLARSASLKFRL